MKAEEFDRIFDDGAEDIIHLVDLNSARRPNKIRRMNVDLPEWMLGELDRESTRLGVTRQSLVKVWLAERIKSGA